MYTSASTSTLTDYGRWKYTATSSAPLNSASYKPEEPDYVERFQMWKRAWQRSVVFSSSLDEMVASPWMQRIVGLGTKAVPLILNDLRSEPSHLMLALPEILRINPVPEALFGDTARMASFWIDWVEQNYIDQG